MFRMMEAHAVDRSYLITSKMSDMCDMMSDCLSHMLSLCLLLMERHNYTPL